MKILYHHRTMGRGAEGVHIASMVTAFKNLGHTVMVVSPPGVDPINDIGRNPLDKSDEKTTGMDTLWKIISQKAPQIFFEILELFYNITAILNLKKILDRHKIDMIYERNAYFLFAGAMLAKHYHIQSFRQNYG